MAEQARLRWNRDALEQVRFWPEASAELKRRADAIAAACGGPAAGFIAVTGEGKTRSRAAVIAASPATLPSRFSPTSSPAGQAVNWRVAWPMRPI